MGKFSKYLGRFRLGAVIAGALLAWSGNAMALVATTGCTNATTCTAVEMNNGGTMTVDQLGFSRTGTTFISSGFSEMIAPNENNVFIIGNSATAGMPTLLWDENGEHFVNDGYDQTFANIDYTFDIVIAPGYEIYGTTVVLTPNEFTTDDARLTANLVVGGNSNLVQIMGASVDGSTPTPADSNMIGFAGLTGTVQATLLLDALMINSDGSDFGAFETIETVFKVRQVGVVDDPIVDVPEPGTFALFTLGLAGLGFMRRQKLPA